MDKIFGINLIAWDFDGTLFQINGGVWSDIFEAQYKIIMNHTGWGRERAVEEHAKVYKAVTHSSTDAVARICNISIIEALMESEEYYDRAKYVSFDTKLIEMFNTIKKYRHVMYVNGKRSKEEPVIAKLGLDPGIFETWITPEETGAVKPDKKMAEYLLHFAKCRPEEILIVGDREKVDLVAGRALGMKTCLVWSDTPGEIADVTLPDVYRVPEIL